MLWIKLLILLSFIAAAVCITIFYVLAAMVLHSYWLLIVPTVHMTAWFFIYTVPAQSYHSPWFHYEPAALHCTWAPYTLFTLCMKTPWLYICFIKQCVKLEGTVIHCRISRQLRRPGCFSSRTLMCLLRLLLHAVGPWNQLPLSRYMQSLMGGIFDMIHMQMVFNVRNITLPPTVSIDLFHSACCIYWAVSLIKQHSFSCKR